MSQVIDLSDQVVAIGLYNAGDVRQLYLRCISGATRVEVGANIEFEVIGIERSVIEGEGRGS